MNKQVLFLRIISAFFLASALINGCSLFWIKPTSVLFISYTILFSLVMLIVAVGLFKLMRWARFAALILLAENMVELLIHSLHDIRLMSDRSGGDLGTIILSVIIVGLFVAVQIIVIWWLSKSSTKALFKHKNTKKTKGESKKKQKGDG